MLRPADSVPVQTLPNLAGATLEELRTRLHEQAAEAARLKASLEHAETRIQALTLELAHLKRLRYGVNSEALTAVQRDLFQETVETDQAALEAEVEHATPAARAPRARAGRQPLPPHLPRREVRHEGTSKNRGERLEGKAHGAQ